MESIGSWIKGKHSRRIDEAVLQMRRQEKETNRLKQFSNDFLMYGKYSVEKLEDVINTVNRIHAKQTKIEQSAVNANLGNIKNVIEAMTFGFDLQLFIKVSEEEHVTQLQTLEHAVKK